MGHNDKRLTADDLKAMQEYPLWQKIQVSQARIMEFANKFDNQIYIIYISVALHKAS